jgi:hypothetical protein
MFRLGSGQAKEMRAIMHFYLGKKAVIEVVYNNSDATLYSWL